MRNLLNELTQDILEVERFLTEFPITTNVRYGFLGDTCHLIWNKTDKRIHMSSGEVCKHLDNFCVDMRVRGHEYLPGFIEHCISVQGRQINEQTFRQVQGKIHDILKQHQRAY